MSVDRRDHDVRDGEHPDAERLAEFVDGLLDDRARESVEAHVAICDQCRFVVSTTADFIAADGPTAAEAPGNRVLPFRRRSWLLAGAATLAAAASVFLVVRGTRPVPGRSAELGALLAAVGNQQTRPIEGRLFEFPYGPPPMVRRGSQVPGRVEASPDLRIAAAALKEAAAGQVGADAAAARGLAAATIGNVDAAVAEFERAVQDAPTNARVRSDLSAAYIARATASGQANDYTNALAAADRAIALDPMQREACFNRALALQYLSRADETRQAWQRCLAIEADERWKTEIGERLTALAP